MAKANSTPPTTGPGFNDAGVTYGHPQAVPTAIYIQKSVNNRTSVTLSYQAMNQAVVVLDATFLALPLVGPGQATQQAWDTVSGAWAGIAVCGCKNDTINGQKLFRLSNWIATTKGQAPNTSAPIAMLPNSTGLDGIIYSPNIPFPGTPNIQINRNTAPTQMTYVFQAGLGLANPQVVMNATVFSASIPNTDSRYAQIAGSFRNGLAAICSFAADGTPWVVENVTVTTIP